MSTRPTASATVDAEDFVRAFRLVAQCCEGSDQGVLAQVRVQSRDDQYGTRVLISAGDPDKVSITAYVPCERDEGLDVALPRRETLKALLKATGPLRIDGRHELWRSDEPYLGTVPLVVPKWHHHTSIHVTPQFDFMQYGFIRFHGPTLRETLRVADSIFEADIVHSRMSRRLQLEHAIMGTTLFAATNNHTLLSDIVRGEAWGEDPIGTTPMTVPALAVKLAKNAIRKDSQVFFHRSPSAPDYGLIAVGGDLGCTISARQLPTIPENWKQLIIGRNAARAEFTFKAGDLLRGLNYYVEQYTSRWMKPGPDMLLLVYVGDSAISFHYCNDNSLAVRVRAQHKHGDPFVFSLSLGRMLELAGAFDSQRQVSLLLGDLSDCPHIEFTAGDTQLVSTTCQTGQSYKSPTQLKAVAAPPLQNTPPKLKEPLGVATVPTTTPANLSPSPSQVVDPREFDEQLARLKAALNL